MAPTKLTLSIDAELIEKARRYSRSRGTSISQVVSRFLAALPEEDGSEQYPPTVRRLLGSAEGGPDRDDYHGFLLEKYGR